MHTFYSRLFGAVDSTKMLLIMLSLDPNRVADTQYDARSNNPAQLTPRRHILMYPPMRLISHAKPVYNLVKTLASSLSRLKQSQAPCRNAINLIYRKAITAAASQQPLHPSTQSLRRGRACARGLE